MVAAHHSWHQINSNQSDAVDVKYAHADLTHRGFPPVAEKAIATLAGFAFAEQHKDYCYFRHVHEVDLKLLFFCAFAECNCRHKSPNPIWFKRR